MAGNREDRRERRLQPFVLACLGRRTQLQERAIRGKLGLQQERHGQDAGALGETLANAFLLGERVLSHGLKTSSSYPRRCAAAARLSFIDFLEALRCGCWLLAT